MLLQGDVKNLVPVKCLLRNDLEPSPETAKTQQFDDEEVISSNPFTPGTIINSDAELILELWRDGRLEEYYAKPKQVSDRVCCNMLSGTTLWQTFTTELFWEFRRRRNIEKCHRPSHSFVKPYAVIFVQILIAGSKLFTSNLLEWKIYTFHFYSVSSYFRRNLTEIISFNTVSEVWPKKLLSSSNGEKYVFIIHRLPRYKKLRELFHQSVLGPQVLLWRRREGGKKLMETTNMFQLLRLIRRKKNSNLFAAFFPNFADFI